jgi:hypothetical protein
MGALIHCPRRQFGGACERTLFEKSRRLEKQRSFAPYNDAKYMHECICNWTLLAGGERGGVTFSKWPVPFPFRKK